jgi:hypothetical protein
MGMIVNSIDDYYVLGGTCGWYGYSSYNYWQTYLLFNPDQTSTCFNTGSSTITNGVEVYTTDVSFSTSSTFTISDLTLDWISYSTSLASDITDSSVS